MHPYGSCIRLRTCFVVVFAEKFTGMGVTADGSLTLNLKPKDLLFYESVVPRDVSIFLAGKRGGGGERGIDGMEAKYFWNKRFA